MIILHYIPSIDRSSGGVGAYMQLLAKELGKLCKLHIVTHLSDNMLEIENAHLHFISKNWKPFTKAKGEFIEILDTLHPDVFHTNCCWSPMSSKTVFWAKMKKIPCVYTPHGMLEPWILKRNHWTKKVPALFLYQKKSIELASVLHATAESEKLHLLELGYNKNIDVVPNCVDLDTIPINTNIQQSHKIVFLSRIHVKKGINFLIEAVAQLKDALKGYEVVIAGEGDEQYVNSLRELANKLGVSSIIKFIGGIYEEDKWNLLQQADLFVLPTHSENFGIVVAEALACKTPVITTTGTPWEELNAYNCGWWIEVGTEPLVHALHSFLSKSYHDLSEMGNNGRCLVEEKYSSVIIAKKMIKLYENIK